MKANFDIETYRSKFSGGFARTFHFYVNFSFPSWVNAAIAGAQGALSSEGMENLMKDGFDSGNIKSLIDMGTAAQKAGTSVAIDATALGRDTKDFPYYVKSTSLPSTNIEEISTHWQGQAYKIAGVQNYEDWSVSLNVDVDAMVLKRFGDWQRMIRNPQTNVISRPATYTADQEVHLLGPNGETVCMYTLYGAWPRTVGAVTLDYSDTSIASVEVTFAYQYHMIFEKEQGSLRKFAKQYVWGGIGGQAYKVTAAGAELI